MLEFKGKKKILSHLNAISTPQLSPEPLDTDGGVTGLPGLRSEFVQKHGEKNKTLSGHRDSAKSEEVINSVNSHTHTHTQKH